MYTLVIFVCSPTFVFRLKGKKNPNHRCLLFVCRFQDHMDGKENLSSTKESSDSERFPSIFKYIASNSISGFDTTPSPRSDIALFEVSHVLY